MVIVRKAFSVTMLALLLTSMLTLAFNVRVDEYAHSSTAMTGQQAGTLSEAPLTEWSKTYGGTGLDVATALVQTSDGGYAIAGVTDSFGAGGYDFWLVKTDASGNAQWNKTYGGTSEDYDGVWALVQTADGGYALAGETESFGAGQDDFWLVKTAPWTPTPPAKFSIGDRVQTTANLNVREEPGLSYIILGTMPMGTIGRIMGGPIEADGYVWWDVDYDMAIRGWSAENWLDICIGQPPSCHMSLEKDGVEIDQVDVSDSFDICVGGSTDDVGMDQVRFSNDYVRDGKPTGRWTEWYDWSVSLGDWNATTKIRGWAFYTPGNKEVWAEMKDESGQTARCSANICALAPAIPVLVSPLVISPVKDMYSVGDLITAEFTLRNMGDTPIVLDKLTVGGRRNGFIPPEGAPDFTLKSVTLDPNEPYQYQGSLTLSATGNYRFFVAYYVEDPTPDEERLLDENNWNTCVELGEGLTHTDRVKNIVVYEEGTLPQEVSQLRETINRWIDMERQVPVYLIDPEVSWAASVWITVSSVWTHVQEQYDELWLAGVDHMWMSKTEAVYAKSFLDKGDIDCAKKHLQSAFRQNKISSLYFVAAAETFDRNVEAAIETVKTTLELIEVGVSLVNPVAGKAASYIFIIPNVIADDALVGTRQALVNGFVDATFKILWGEWNYPQLGGRTLENYLNNKVGKFTFPLLQELFINNEALQFHLSHALKEIVGEEAEWLIQRILNELGILRSSETYKKHSPVELRVYDSKGKTTGLINGTIRHEIPISFYRNGTITVFFPAVSCTCEVTGKEDGTYGLEVSSVSASNTTTFTATGIPISTNAIHDYMFDWALLNEGKEGVSVRVDSEGDGACERTFFSDTTLTSDEFAMAMGGPIVESCNSTGTVKDSFDLSDSVYVKGEGYSPSATYDLYVVNATTWSDGKPIPQRIEGTATTITSDTSGNISVTPAWNAPITLGNYDIVVDVNRDGYYNSSIDALDQSNIQIKAGFQTIPEFPSAILTVFMAVAILAAALTKKNRTKRFS